MSGHSRMGSTGSGGSRKSISASAATSPTTTTSTSRIPGPSSLSSFPVEAASPSASASAAPRLKKRDSLLSTENSLNPILRINRTGSAASAATSTSTATAMAIPTTSLTQTQTTPATSPAGSSKKSAERSRRVSSSAESLRKNIAAAAKGRSASPAPSSPSGNRSLKASPSAPTADRQTPIIRAKARAASASASSPSRLPGPGSSIKRPHTPPALPSLIRRSSGSSSSLSSIARASPSHSPHSRHSQFQVTAHPRSPSNTPSTGSNTTASFNLIQPSAPTTAIVQTDALPSYSNDDALPQTSRPGAPLPTISAAATESPTSGSPQPGSRSIDYLKSSLRETLNSDGQARRRKASDASSHSASIARRKKRRSVSFAVEPALEGVGALSKRSEESQGIARDAPADITGISAVVDVGASAAVGAGRFSGISGIEGDVAGGESEKTTRPVSSPTASASTSASPSASAASPDASLSSAISSLSSSASRPRRRLSYPDLKNWEPLSPESGDITLEEREHLAGPLQLAKSLFPNFDERRSTSSSASADGAKVRQTPQQLRRRAARANPAVLAPWWNRGQLAIVHQLVETVVGVVLAVAWLALGKIIGAEHVRVE